MNEYGANPYRPSPPSLPPSLLTRLDSIEIPRLARTVLILPPVRLTHHLPTSLLPSLPEQHFVVLAKRGLVGCQAFAALGREEGKRSGGVVVA